MKTVRLTSTALSAINSHKLACAKSDGAVGHELREIDSQLDDLERTVFTEVTAELEKGDAPDASKIGDNQTREAALLEIQEILSGEEWSPDTPEAIADVMRNAGYTIDDTPN